MKKVILILSNVLFHVALLHATDLNSLITPGAERGRLEQKYLARLQSDRDSIKAIRELGIIYHMKAVEGPVEIDYIRESHSLLKKAYAQDKTHTITKAFLGSITTMMAITVEESPQKMKYVNRGTRLLDKAIRDDPEHLELRMLRGRNSLKLPKFFNRARIAVLDFQHVLKLTKNASVEFRASLHFNLGQAYEMSEEPEKANAQWQQVIRLAPHSPEAEKARDKI